MTAARDTRNIDSLIAIARHKAAQNALKSELRKLRRRKAEIRKRLTKAVKALDNEVSSDIELSEEIAAMRTQERH
jgi:hypothetical protein